VNTNLSGSRRAPVPAKLAALVWISLGAAGFAFGSPVSTTTTLVFVSGGKQVTTVNAGAVVILAATVTHGAGTVTPGFVRFCDATAYCEDSHVIGSAQLATDGKATFKFRPAIGNHTYKAIFTGTRSDAPSVSAAVSLAVDGLYPSTTTIAQSGPLGNYALTATVTGPAPSMPTGTASFFDTTEDNALLGKVALGQPNPVFGFLSPSKPPEGVNPVSIAVGDFNRDGIPDLAVANYNGNNLSILLGDGTGHFVRTTAIPATGNNPIAVVAADFNADGNPDLAVANYKDGTVTILLGNGLGAFTAASTALEAGKNPDGLVTGDFNGDGNADLAVANYGSNSVTVLLGDGAGKFTAASASPATGREPTSIVTGDFNGDGIADLAVTDYQDDSISVLLGKGDGTFSAAHAFPTYGTGPAAIIAADFLGRGVLDLAVANFGSDNATVFTGDGQGGFNGGSLYQTGSEPYALAAADFNLNGYTDLAVANYQSGTVTVLMGYGGTNLIPFSPSPPTGLNPAAIAVGDWNGDGTPDLVTANYNDTGMTVLLSENSEFATAVLGEVTLRGAGNYQVDAAYSGDASVRSSKSGTTTLAGSIPTGTTLAVTAQGAPVTSVASGIPIVLTAAVLQDGAPLKKGKVDFCDALAKSCTGTHLAGSAQLTAEGNASFKFTPAIGSHSYTAEFEGVNGSLPSASAASALTVTAPAKLPTTTTLTQSGGPGDYTLTATVGAAGPRPPAGKVTFFDKTSANAVLGTASLGMPGLTLLNTQNLAIGHSCGNVSPGTTTAAVADFNRDGKLDLVVAESCEHSVSVYLGNGDGTFTSKGTLPTQIEPVNVAVADFNGDGIPDIAVGQRNNYGSDLSVFLGRGDGTFTGGFVSGVGGNAIAVADFNGDGIPDIVTGNYSEYGKGGALNLFLGKGNGSFAPPVSIGGINGPISMAAADVNGDGRADLIACGGGYVWVFLGNGDGSFRLSDKLSGVGFALADFNGDGILDLATNPFVEFSSGVLVFLGNGDGTFTQTATSPLPGTENAPLLATGDFNGDGIPDLFTGGAPLLGDGHGNFIPTGSSPPVASFPISVAAGDFNNDGLSDLAIVDFFGYSADILLSATQTGTAVLPNISPIGSGMHQVAASFPGGSVYSSSVSANVSLTAQQLPPKIALTASSASVKAGTPLTLTAKVTPGASLPRDVPKSVARTMETPPTPTGSITFLSGSLTLGSVKLNAQGTAALTTSTLATGTDSITAAYSGDSNYFSLTSSPITVTVTAAAAPR
jgi:hypothetical protein